MKYCLPIGYLSLVFLVACATKKNVKAPNASAVQSVKKKSKQTEKTPAKSRAYKDKTEIDFDSVDVEAELVKPSGSLILERRKNLAEPSTVKRSIASPSVREAPRRAPDVVLLKQKQENTEEYIDHGINPFVTASKDKYSTFSIDVDTASYTIGRRKIGEGRLPPFASVRVEEYVNYFKYDYPATKANPFDVHLEAMPHPFQKKRHVLRVGVQGKKLSKQQRPTLRLTFLIDVSGSMKSPDKLPLAMRSMHMLVDSLRDDDSVAIVTYAGRIEKILEPTYGDNKKAIHQAIDRLQSGGGTAMASGVDLAYEMAWSTFKQGAENRVVVLSDGDANIGPKSWKELLTQIKDYADRGVTLSTIGLGMGNYKDNRMEKLANKGDGNNYYIDSAEEAKRLFVDGFNETMITIARDVKIQVEFNPKIVQSYRLIGYENRDIADKNFRNDRVDAGEVGAGHRVTALYELLLKPKKKRAAKLSQNLATVRLRYEAPGADKKATERAWAFTADQIVAARQASQPMRLAYTAATFAEFLRRSPHVASYSVDTLIQYGEKACRKEHKDEQELLMLLRQAKKLGLTAFGK